LIAVSTHCRMKPSTKVNSIWWSLNEEGGRELAQQFGMSSRTAGITRFSWGNSSQWVLEVAGVGINVRNWPWSCKSINISRPHQYWASMTCSKVVHVSIQKDARDSHWQKSHWYDPCFSLAWCCWTRILRQNVLARRRCTTCLVWWNSRTPKIIDYLTFVANNDIHVRDTIKLFFGAFAECLVIYWHGFGHLQSSKMNI
jgi:hypothetical protein